jgi:hypothetical protein
MIRIKRVYEMPSRDQGQQGREIFRIWCFIIGI